MTRAFQTLIAAGLLVVACTSCSKEPARPNLLLISIDTLRADRLAPETSPHLEALAQRGLRFTHAQSPRAKTTPAMASVMTGLYPHQHGVRDLATPLGAGPRTLAETLRDRGWRTAAVIGNYVLRRELSGLDRGFDTWIEDLPETMGVPPDDVPERRATSLTDEALALLGLSQSPRSRPRPAPLGGAREGRSGDPWFLWLHYMDPHGHYDPPPGFVVRTDGAPMPIDLAEAPRGAHQPHMAAYNLIESDWQAGRVDAARVIARYDGEVRYVDAEIGRLIDALDRADLTDNTWVVVLADHGESLGEHRYWFEHGRYAYEATCRVPLVVVPPLAARQASGAGAFRPGVRESDISLVDLFPTLSAWLGVHEGNSLTDLLHGEAQEPHPVFMEKVEASNLRGALQTKAVRLGDWKLLRRFTFDGQGMRSLDEQLFDLAADPREEQNLGPARPPAAPLSLLRSMLIDFCRADKEWNSLSQDLLRERDALLLAHPDVASKLRALGY